MPYWPEALAVSVRFFLIFLILPALALDRSDPLGDRLALGFTAAVSASVLIGHLLSGLDLYEPIALWGSTMVVGLIWIARQIDLRESFMRKWMRRLDWLEDNQKRVLERTRQLLAWLGQKLRAVPLLVMHPDFPIWMIGLAVAAWSAWLRYLPYLEHAYFGASDGYVHLEWLKYIEGYQVPKRKISLYAGGIYPRGYHVILSVFGLLTFLDRVLILRFAGPIGGLLLVLSLAYAGWKLRLRPGAVVVSMAVIGLGFSSPLPANAWRQTQPLPQEFAAMFVLPGLVQAWEYLKGGNRNAALITVMTVFLTASIHTYSLIYLAIAVTLLTVAGWIAGRVPIMRAVTLAGLCAAATALAILPMGIATLLGVPWHGSLGYVAGQVKLLPPEEGLRRIFSGNLFIDAGLLLTVALVIAGARMVRRSEGERAPLLLTTGLMLLLLFTQTHGRTGIPVLMDPVRSGLFFSLFLVLAVGFAMDEILGRLRLGSRPQALAAAGLIALYLVAWRPQPVTSRGYEYDEAVDAYLRISREFTRQEWYIVSPVEQYSQVMGSGWHENVTTFLARVDRVQVIQPKYKHYLGTPDVLVFVEKWPLGSAGPVEPDADAPLTLQGLTPQQVIDRYYRDPQGRRLMEQRIWGVMEAYRSAHPDQVRIYFDSERFRVYQIHDERQKQKTTGG